MRIAVMVMALASVAHAERYTPDVVQEVARIALGSDLPDARAKQLASDLSSGKVKPAQAVDEMLADPRFASVVAPQVLLGTWDQPSFFGQSRQLHATPDAKDKALVYHLGKPCPREQAVAVHPWWALDTEVLVCRDDYRPEARRSKTGVACENSSIEPNELEGCGCGPNLVLCTKDEKQAGALVDQMYEEITETIAKGTELGKPLEWLYTANETFRRPLAELHYQRVALLDGAIKELPDVRRWPEAGQLAPRAEIVPGEQAGLLTAQGLLYMREGHRVRQVIYGELLWCIQTRTVRTDVEAILALGHGNFRDGDGWHHLATTAPCSGCHARMDYGHQFFLGFPRGLDGWVWKRDQVATGEGPLYLRDDHDLRGQAPLTPAGFAKLAVEQPEFGQCAIQRVGQHVLGAAWDRPAFEVLQGAWQSTGHTLRPLMSAALVRYLEKRAPEKATPEKPSTIDKAGFVHLGSTTAERVERLCSGCHTQESLDLTSEHVAKGLGRDVVLRMLNQVSLKLMPKASAPPLALGERRAFTGELVDAAFPATQRAEARRYFLAELLGDRIELPRTTIDGGQAGNEPLVPTNTVVESRVRRDDVRYTPGLMALQDVAAARRCRAQKLAGAQLKACLRAGTDVGLGVDLVQKRR